MKKLLTTAILAICIFQYGKNESVVNAEIKTFLSHVKEWLKSKKDQLPQS